MSDENQERLYLFAYYSAFLTKSNLWELVLSLEETKDHRWERKPPVVVRQQKKPRGATKSLTRLQHLPRLLYKFKYFGLGLCTKHRDAGFSVVRNAFEQGRGSKMTADVTDAAQLRILAKLEVDGVLGSTIDAYLHLTFQNIYFVVE